MIGTINLKHRLYAMLEHGKFFIWIKKSSGLMYIWYPRENKGDTYLTE